METLVIILFLALVGFGLYYYLNQQSSHSQRNAEELNRRMEETQKMMLGQLNTVISQVGKSVNESRKATDERLDGAARAMNSVMNELSSLKEHNKRIHEIGKDLTDLQQILKAPKLRGQLGELFLENLLKDRFSSAQYEMQYKFKSGDIVDAVIKLRDGKLVPIDAKFSLENFKKLIEVQGSADDKKKAKKAFRTDIKNRIDEISNKYILPDEGTLEFALMYIPAENVYYEVVIQDTELEGPSMIEYAFSKNVFPVSPNTFAIYLTTILNGLRGLEIEKRAGEIMAGLARLNVDFSKFNEDFRLVGTHLGRAKNSYEDSERKLGRLGDKISAISGARNNEKVLIEE
ncbi:MAG: DNA recombination protein RmuC [Candidatus Gracilibacteria bacterium]|jgi:DNA recombination protein RmuC